MLARAQAWRVRRGALLLLLAGLALTAQARLLSAGQVSLAGDMDVLLDPSATLRIEDVTRQETAKRFERLPGQPSLGYVTGAAWLRLTLTRPAEAATPWWLELSSGLIDEVELYLPEANGGWSRRVSGDIQPWRGRDLAYPTPVFRLDLPPDQPVTLYLRLRSMATLSTSLQIRTTEAFLSSSNTQMLAFGIVIGVHLVLILSNLWFFQATRDSIYLLFSLYTLINGLSGLTADGLLHQYVLQDWPSVNDKVQILSFLLSLPTGIMFFLQYLERLKPPRPRWVKLLIILPWTAALGASALLWGTEPRWLRPAYLLWMSGVSTFMCMVLLRLAWRGNRAARLVLWTAPLALTSLLIRLGNNSGILQSNPFSDHLIYASSTMYVLTLNYGVSRRYKEMQQAKEEAQNRALQISQESGHRLEELVTVRTRALQQALKLVESSLSAERQTHEEQRRFFSTVSHELRTPLAVIDATAKNLELDGQYLDAATQRRYAKLQRATDQLAVLIKNCFQEDRFEPLRHGPHRQATDLNELLFDTHESAVLQSQQHHVHIEADDLPEAFVCDPEGTRLALRTLAGNAIKYTPPGTQVVLRGELYPTGVALEVIDNGPGVCAEDFPHLFERYYRGKNATSVPGTGLGLPLARGLIEMQGGSLTVNSTAGQGFRATLWLPLSESLTGLGESESLPRPALRDAAAENAGRPLKPATR